jgi:elongation factor Ts
MAITASLVKELREKTGVGMMDCKKALTETNGNLEEAIKYLREKGLSVATKKAGREANEGNIFIYLDEAGKKGVILELNCETDFVAKSDPFKELGNSLVSTIASQAALTTVEELQSTNINGKQYKEFVSEYIMKVGENLGVKKFQAIETSGSLSSYVHMNGKIGVLVEFNQSIEEDLGKDISMQIAAANPRFVRAEDIPAEEIEKEKDIIKNQALNSGRPEKVIEQIVQGKIRKYCQEICLLDQEFVKDTDKKIKQILPAGVDVVRFERYSLG